MRIALISPPWLPVPPPAYGGTEAILDRLARGFAAAGHEVLLFATGDSTCPVPTSWVMEEAATDRMGNAVAEIHHVAHAYEIARSFDIIHDHTLIGPLFAAQFDNLPVVTTNHGPFDCELLSLYRAISPRVPIIAISHDQARSAGDVPIAAVIHHGLDPEAFPVGRGDGGYFLYLGRMAEAKGAREAALVARRAGVPLMIAAKMREPAEKDYFEREVRPLLGAGVVFLGEVGGTEKLELLGGARALLNPIGWPEPFGLVMIEALACGTPVLAFPNGSAPEIVDHGRTGFLCRNASEMEAAPGSGRRARSRRLSTGRPTVVLDDPDGPAAPGPVRPAPGWHPSSDPRRPDPHREREPGSSPSSRGRRRTPAGAARDRLTAVASGPGSDREHGVAPGSPARIPARRLRAVIFDTDGVIIRTAEIHAAAWKSMFDQFLSARNGRTGEVLTPFTPDDYRRYVDGRARADGVAQFLESRGIALERGSPGDDPGRDTVWGLGNRKNQLFLARVHDGGVEAYGSTVDLVRRLRSRGIATAAVSASENAGAMLEAAGTGELFDARVDGVDARDLGSGGQARSRAVPRSGAPSRGSSGGVGGGRGCRGRCRGRPAGRIRPRGGGRPPSVTRGPPAPRGRRGGARSLLVRHRRARAMAGLRRRGRLGVAGRGRRRRSGSAQRCVAVPGRRTVRDQGRGLGRSVPIKSDGAGLGRVPGSGPSPPVGGTAVEPTRDRRCGPLPRNDES